MGAAELLSRWEAAVEHCASGLPPHDRFRLVLLAALALTADELYRRQWLRSDCRTPALEQAIACALHRDAGALRDGWLPQASADEVQQWLEALEAEGVEGARKAVERATGGDTEAFTLALLQLAHALVQQGRKEEARQVESEVKLWGALSPEGQALAHVWLARIDGALGVTGEALFFLRCALRFASYITDLQQRLRALQAIAGALAELESVTQTENR